MSSVTWPVVSSWKDPVVNAAALPASGNTDGDARVDVSTDTIYIWHDAGSNWLAVATPGAAIAIDGLNTDVSASGPGVVAATVNSVGGSSAANVNAATVLANASTSANTASAIVRRDSSGNFSAGTITASLTGLASANANLALSNLASVAVNTALLPGTDNSIALGSSSKRFTTTHAVTETLYGSVSGTCTLAAANTTTNYSVKMPASQGGSATFLKNDGSGNLSWDSAGGSPGGSDTQVQFNDSNAFGGDSAFTWNKGTNVLGVNDMTIDPGYTSEYWGGPQPALLINSDTSALDNMLIASTDTSNGAVITKELTLATGSQLGVGAAGSTGTVEVITGDVTNSGSSAISGLIALVTGTNHGTGQTGNIILHSGYQTGSAGDTGQVALFSGDAAAGNTGTLDFFTGAAGGATKNSGFAHITTGNSALGDSGEIQLKTGVAATGNAGVINLYTGNSANGNGTISIKTGEATNGVSGGKSGDVNIFTADNVQLASSNGVGTINILTGQISDADSYGNGNDILINTQTNSGHGHAGNIYALAGDGGSAGGNVYLNSGTASGAPEVTQIETVADVSGSLNNTYFALSSANDATLYYVWYNVGGGGVDPMAPGTGLQVAVATNATASTVKTATIAKINLSASADFTASSVNTDTLLIVNTAHGPSSDISDSGSTGFTISTFVDGTLGVNGQIIGQNNLWLSHTMSLSFVGETGTVQGFGIDPTVDGSSYAYLIGQMDIPDGNTSTPQRQMLVTTASRNDVTDAHGTDSLYVTVGDNYGTGGTGTLYVAGGKAIGGGSNGGVNILGNANTQTSGSIGINGSYISLGSDNSSGTVGTVQLFKPQVLAPTPQTLTSGGTVSSATSFVQLQAASAISTSTSTVITAGITSGQTLVVVNVGANAITFKSGGNTDLPSLTDFILTASSSISFIWSGSLWYTTSASAN